MHCLGRYSGAAWAVRALVVAAPLAIVGHGSWALEFGTVSPASVQTWKSFRKAQPFQTQVIGLTGSQADSQRTLIVSEPPPSLTWKRVQQVLAESATGCEVRSWTIMSGGRVSDIVCTLKPTDRERWAEALAQLQVEVYGSAEGAPVVTLPAPQRKMIAHSLDLRYSASDLHAWLIKSNPKLRGSPLAPAMSISDLFEKNARGVYATADRSLVVWAMDRGKALDGHRAEVRRFALIGDLVLGAVANKRSVLIVARGRVEPVAHLPPLRSETVLLLAGSGERELAQSYERNDVLSGKGYDDIDRAPILLSPQLVDTEFGNLLNIADQLLKGWSMAGQVRYVDFSYPDPPRYPFGAVPANVVKPGREHFLFNWNTDGAAYVQSIGGMEVMVPQRTGSLSVIYGDPMDRPRDMEDTAYDYFAGLGDTSLSRVQQYTLLYQIFRQFDISAPAPAVSQRFERFTAEVDTVTRRQFNWLLGAGDEKTVLAEIAARVKQDAASISDKEIAGVPGGREALTALARAEYGALLHELRHAQKESNGKVSGAFADVVAAMRRGEVGRNEVKLRAALAILEKYLPGQLLEDLLKDDAKGLKESGLVTIGMHGVKGWTALTRVDADVEGWSRTAYVVESRGRRDTVGGHNLAAPLTRLNADNSIARGAVVVARSEDGGWIVRHNPADSDRLRTVVREVGTRKDLSKSEIESQVAQAIQSARAEAPVALAEVRRAAGTAVEFKAIGGADASWKVRAAAEHERGILADLATARQDAIVMEMIGDGTFVLSRTGVDEVMQLSTITAATDALASALISSAASGFRRVPVLLKGLPDEKAEAWLGTIHATLRRYPKSSVDAVLASAPDRLAMIERAHLVNARVAHNGLRVERTSVSIKPVVDGMWRGYTRVEVPVRLQATQPWYVRVILYIKDFSQASLDRLLNRIEGIMSAIREPLSPADLQAMIRRELDKDLRELQVDGLLLHVPSDASRKVHDIYIAGNETRALGQRAA